jgi:hypothetical protein
VAARTRHADDTNSKIRFSLKANAILDILAQNTRSLMLPFGQQRYFRKAPAGSRRWTTEFDEIRRFSRLEIAAFVRS